MENKDLQTLELRNYQVELLEKVKHNNGILFLPTGSGKTCIVLWLMQYLEIDVKEMNKRTIFLVNTKALVYQQHKYISRLTNFKVKPITADENIDFWTQYEWASIKKDYEVLVMVSQIFLNALNSGYFSITDINLIIFDECHHATKDHPMKKIMLDHYHTIPQIKRPRVVGLSATLLCTKPKKNSDISKSIIELQNTFDAAILTSKNSEEIQQFATNPDEIYRSVPKCENPDSISKEINELNLHALHILNNLKIVDDVSNQDFYPYVLLNVPGQNSIKLLRTLLGDIVTHMEEFGLYFGYECCECYIRQLYRYAFSSKNETYVNAIFFVLNIVQQMRKVMYSFIILSGPINNYDTIENHSTEKFKIIVQELKKFQDEDRCIIFVERKMTAKILHRTLRKVFTTNDKIKVDFITGSECNPLRNTREGIYSRKIKSDILKNFKDGSINVLIATNLLEEGVDVQTCNLVIMFNNPKNFRSYIQSKGRARMKNSRYILLNDEGVKLAKDIAQYQETENILKNVLFKTLIDEDFSDDDSDDNTDTRYITNANATVTPVSAVSIIYRYCSKLPCDLFTKLAPYWWIEKTTNHKILCRLQLPSNSPIRTLIEGIPSENKRKAKQMAAFEGVKLLHKIGALNDHLLTQELPTEVCDWFPSQPKNAAFKENIECKVKIPNVLLGSRPVPGISYLHIISLEPKYSLPEINRKMVFDGLMKDQYVKFGILTSTQWPKLCDFPVFSDLGEITVTIHCNARKIMLNNLDIQEICKFHKFLFMNILRILPDYFMYDTKDENGYFIVPLRLNETENIYDITWNVIQDKVDINQVPLEQVPETMRANLKHSENKYLFNVVVPWYINQHNPLYYIVTNYENRLNENSFFEKKGNNFTSYEKYYKEKYNLNVTVPHQSLIEVRPIKKDYNGIRPKPFTASEKAARKMKESLSHHFIPEFCLTEKFPAVYWYKATLLPSILHRLYFLLLAEQLRNKIASDIGFDSVTFIKDSNDKLIWEPSQSDTSVQSRNNKKEKLKKTAKKLAFSRNKKKEMRRTSLQKMERVIKDIDHAKDVSLHDINMYVKYVDTIINVTKNYVDHDDLSSQFQQRSYEVDFVNEPALMILKKQYNPKGPKQHEILEALTPVLVDDIINYERLETLGDSFLKYAISFALYVKYPLLDEGQLTQLKSFIVGNKHLFDCGMKHELGSYMKMLKFDAYKTWCPSGFSFPRYLLENEENEYSPHALLGIKIPHDEQFSGEISEETKVAIKEKILEQKQESATEYDTNVALFHLNKQIIQSKRIADVMEALIGVYLLSGGIKSTFRLLKYFGILLKDTLDDLFCHELPSPSCNSNSQTCIKSLVPDYQKLEQLLNYEFNDKTYIIQALSHPSYISNSLTECYQRLEFIGDAILDFLITIYIFEYCDKLSPGKITDLRSALVNNNVFGALAVRLNLHKYLLSRSTPLLQAINYFLDYQESKNYEIVENELMILINDGDTTIAEEVDIPKALGDIFESIAGAIYLDSGYNLEKVWHIFYNFMKNEIHHFSKNIPINPVRALHEMHPNVKFHTIGNNKNKLKVQLTVKMKKETKCYYSQGVSLNVCKRAAAKLALKDFGFNNFVI